MPKVKKMKQKYPILCYFKNFFKIILMSKKIVSNITKIVYSMLKKLFFIERSLSINQKDEKFKKCDFVVKYRLSSLPK